MDQSVHALQYLDIIQMKDPNHKANFYHNLKNVLPFIPKVSTVFVVARGASVITAVRRQSAGVC